MKKTIIMVVSALALLVAPAAVAKKKVVKSYHRNSAKTTVASSNKLRVYDNTDGDYCGVYTIAVKGNQAWGWSLERSVGYVGIYISDVTPTSMRISAPDGCDDASGKATITPSAITLGKYRMKYDPKSQFQVYTSGDWVLLLNPEQYDDMAVIYDTRLTNVYYQLRLEDFSANGFGVVGATKWCQKKGSVEVLASMDGDMPVYVMKSGDDYNLMTEIADIPPLTFKRVR